MCVVICKHYTISHKGRALQVWVSGWGWGGGGAGPWSNACGHQGTTVRFRIGLLSTLLVPSISFQRLFYRALLLYFHRSLWKECDGAGPTVLRGFLSVKENRGSRPVGRFYKPKASLLSASVRGFLPAGRLGAPASLFLWNKPGSGERKSCVFWEGASCPEEIPGMFFLVLSETCYHLVFSPYPWFSSLLAPTCLQLPLTSWHQLCYALLGSRDGLCLLVSMKKTEDGRWLS